MYCIIDTREHKLIDICKKNNIDIIIKQLDVGDIIIKKNEEILCIIERKTFDDLGASIKDGRYKEQKARLLSNYNNIIYLLEGEYNKCNTIAENILSGAIINMIFRDNIKILYSDSIEHTYKIITQLLKKYSDNTFETIKSNSSNYVDNIKICKKQNLTKETCNIAQLSIIPGISKSIATIIIKEYNSLENIINNLNKDNNSLANIQLNKKKLGTKLSQRLSEYLC
tara:strand:- start:480 stop:1157 length:678 start_codon:yes stop_codon:yes gene_type:complete